MNRFIWSAVPTPKNGTKLWIFTQAVREPGILSWIVKRGPLFLRFEPYKHERAMLNLLTDGRLEGAYDTLEAAKASIVKRSVAEHYLTA